jgi:hypothetical protein
MLAAIAVYESNLHLDGKGNDLPNGEEAPANTFDQATTTSTTAATTTTEKKG